MKHSRKYKNRSHPQKHSKLLACLVIFFFAGIGSIIFVRSMAAVPVVNSQQTNVGTGKSAKQATGNAHTRGRAAVSPNAPKAPKATNPTAKPTTPPAPAPAKPSAPATAPRTPAPALVPAPPATTGTSRKVKITYYGAYDNDPAGSRDIAHPVIHPLAGGTGSYADPLTFASPTGAGEYAWGQIIYVPSLQKYFIREDSCGVSWTAPDGCGGVDMVDLYMGNPSDSANVIQCEEALTKDGNSEIIVSPASTLAYDPAPLWNQAAAKCAGLH